MSELVVLLLLVPLIGAVLSGLGRYTRGLPLAEIAAPGAVCASLALLVPLAPRALGGGPPLVYELGNWAEPVGIALYMVACLCGYFFFDRWASRSTWTDWPGSAR